MLYEYDYVMGSGPHGPDAPRPLLTGPLCPMANQAGSKALLKLQMAPRLILWISLGSEKRSPDTHVWVRPKPDIHKECEPRFPLSLHTSYTMDCPAALVSEDASSACYVQ